MNQAEITKNLDYCICANLRKASRLVTQAYDEAFRSLGLRSTQIIILINASKSAFVKVTELSAQLLMDRTTLTRNLKPLEKQGFIKVEVGADRRERNIALTAKGKNVLGEAFPLWQKKQIVFMKTVGKEGCADLLRKVDAFVEAIKR